MKGLPAAMQQRVLRASVAAGARVMRTALRAAAPVGNIRSEASLKYGRTYDNIRISRLKRGPKSWAGYRVSAGKAYWASWYEFGNAHQPARPWFRPTFDAATAQALRAMAAAAARGLARETKKLTASYGTVRRTLTR